MILMLAALATFGVMASAVRNGQRAKQTQVALDRAQEEMEKLHSLTYKQLAMTTTPVHEASTLSPNSRVLSNGTFALQASRRAPTQDGRQRWRYRRQHQTHRRRPRHAPPDTFKNGDVTGELYRYVVWRNDSKPAESEEVKKDFCPGSQDFKQIVVADQAGHARQPVGRDAATSKPSPMRSTRRDGQPHDGRRDGRLRAPKKGGPAAPGKSVTAQQFFLTDTPCGAAGTTEREESTGDHLLHNTLGTCASGPQTGTTIGAPDALLLGGPPDPAPEDPTNPALLDYSNDAYLGAAPDTDKGVQIRQRRHQRLPLHARPGTTNPESQVHRWVTDPMAPDFKMTGKVTLEVYTRTLNDALYRARSASTCSNATKPGTPRNGRDRHDADQQIGGTATGPTTNRRETGSGRELHGPRCG